LEGEKHERTIFERGTNKLFNLLFTIPTRYSSRDVEERKEIISE